jgi:hypothetical protein
MTSHPLDVDLADLVDGVLDAARAADLEAHLDACLLCRLKRRRLEGAPAPASAGGFLPGVDFDIPVFEPGGDPAVDDLWVAGEDDRLLVLVLGVAGDRITAAPVTFDVHAADDETVVVDQSPFREPVAVHPALALEIPRAALTAKVGVLTLAGAAGRPIAGPSDPRIQVRQYLVDRLAVLADPPAAAAGDPPPPRPEQVRSSLIADLRSMRGRSCAARALDAWGDLVLAEQRAWTPLVTVDEVGVVLVVFDTPHGLEDELDFDAARSVLTRLNASALVVLTGELSELADVFDAAALHAGIDMPSGAHNPPRPLISGLVPFDAIAKFLDQHSGARAMTAPTRSPLARVEVADVLRDAAAAAVADLARQGARFKIAPKRRGYESIAGAEDAIAGALATAFEGGSVVDALQELAAGPERPPERGEE